MSKMEVEIVLKSGEVEQYNPVGQIVISNIGGYDYEFDPADIKEIKVYPMVAPTNTTEEETE